MCPFCYIGKKNLEEALQKTNADVNIEWKSFQLNPNLTDEPQSTSEYLKKMRGMSDEQLKGTLEHLKKAGAEKGIVFNQENGFMVNTSKAHKVIQLAKTKNLGDTAEEVFFKAYFTDNKNVADINVLKELAVQIGLKSEDVDEALTNPTYTEMFQKDLKESREIGVSGVPFFVFNRKYAISGAQPVEAFVSTINKVAQESTDLIITQGESCDLDGNCN